MSISTTIKSIQDIMRKDVGVDGDAQRIGQLVWLLFLKIFDDREQEWEMFSDDYRSPIPEPLRWRNWAADPEGMTVKSSRILSITPFSPACSGYSPRVTIFAVW
jgi:type I restriction enzyme M protein|nr:type I restriction-modification system subunit M N-terminal domain-containing protein [uncultured Halomonas sp.]